MITLRFAALVAAAVTITLNAAYGFKTSATFEYAILFAALNAALDIAKCACLAGANRAWHNRQPLSALILFLMFWPLLANSLWCGLSEVAFNRGHEQAKFTTDAQRRALARADHDRAAAELADLEASPLYVSSTACALPKTTRERTLCEKRADAATRLAAAADTLKHQAAADPAPQITLLATWTGYDLSALLLAAGLWPIALAELCGSIGLYAASTPTPARAEPRSKRFWPRKQASPPPTTKTQPKPDQRGQVPATIQWPALTT